VGKTEARQACAHAQTSCALECTQAHRFTHAHMHTGRQAQKVSRPPRPHCPSSSPAILQISLEDGSPDFKYSLGQYACMGRRAQMEDRVIIQDLLPEHQHLFPGARRAVVLGVFDGHAGACWGSSAQRPCLLRGTFFCTATKIFAFAERRQLGG